jgi:hypothetical protein
MDACDAARHQLDDITHRVPQPPPTSPRHQVNSGAVCSGTDDPLLALQPQVYVEQLSGAMVSRAHKINCPFHADRTPSLHVYDEPERGWMCFGCHRGGTVYDFAALLWGMSTRGKDFVDLRARLGRTLF